MCGRFLFLSDEDYNEINSFIDQVSEKYDPAQVAKGDAFPTNFITVIYSHGGMRIQSAAKWGFPNPKSGVVINARAESLAEKPMFKNAFSSKRCLVPANGYYEWLAQEDRKKIKYLIKVREKKLFYMAGLYNIFADGEGNTSAAVTIITTQANPDISFIHSRMPVILKEETAGCWLEADNEPGRLEGLLVPYTAGELVNNAV